MKEENEIFEMDTTEKNTSEPLVEMTPQPTKKKRVLSEQQREKLLANLKKGRETALLNRQKKAYVKKQARKEKDQEIEDKIVKNVMQKKEAQPQKAETKDYSDEINTLKSEIEFLKKSTSKPKEEAVPKQEFVKKVEQQPTAPVEPIEHIISTFDKPFW